MNSDWYVLNVRDAEWRDCGPRGNVTELVRDDDAQVGVNLFVLGPGEPMAMYHWEADQEGYLVLAGEALLIVNDEEHPLGVGLLPLPAEDPARSRWRRRRPRSDPRTRRPHRLGRR